MSIGRTGAPPYFCHDGGIVVHVSGGLSELRHG